MELKMILNQYCSKYLGGRPATIRHSHVETNEQDQLTTLPFILKLKLIM